MSFIAVGIGIGVGAASGGIMSAINHQPIWKGMLLGAATGAAGGGIGAGLGALGGAAGSAGGAAGGSAGGAAGSTGGAAGSAASAAPSIATSSTGGIMPGSVISAMGGPSAIPAGAVPASAGSGITPSAISAVGTSAAPGGALASTPATTAFSGGFTGLGDVGDWAVKSLGPKVITEGAGAVSQGFANKQTEDESNKIHQQFFPGFAHGGDIQHVARHGGSIRLKDGSFIIPADVVSALGNGSSKAGAKYLTHLFRMLEAGPQPRAGSLAKQRAQARHSA